MSFQHIRDHLPLQQGLRLSSSRYHAQTRQEIRYHLPLEQGLRRKTFVYMRDTSLIRDHLPLQQGLRQW